MVTFLILTVFYIASTGRESLARFIIVWMVILSLHTKLFHSAYFHSDFTWQHGKTAIKLYLLTNCYYFNRTCYLGSTSNDQNRFLKLSYDFYLEITESYFISWDFSVAKAVAREFIWQCRFPVPGWRFFCFALHVPRIRFTSRHSFGISSDSSKTERVLVKFRKWVEIR